MTAEKSQNSVSGAMENFLRTCRAGGMPAAESDIVLTTVRLAEHYGHFKVMEAQANRAPQSNIAPLMALAEQYCEGWCKDGGGQGHFSDCTGCSITCAANGDMPPECKPQAETIKLDSNNAA